MANSTHMALISLIAAAAMFSVPALAGPVIVLSNEAVTVTHLIPGRSLALLGVARDTAAHVPRVVVRHELLADHDGDGQVRYAPAKGIALDSVWIAIDTITGELAVAAPDGFRPLEMTERGAGRGEAVETIAGTLDIGRTTSAVLVVRPGVGAWAATVRDGIDCDADRKTDRRIRVDLSRLRPLDRSANTAHALRSGDVVAVLDPASMQYWTTTVE